MTEGWRCQKCLGQGCFHEAVATKAELPCSGKHAGFIVWHEALEAIHARVLGSRGGP